MKNILLATTALVAFAGAASAEITLSGSAEMGVSGGDGLETLFHQSVDITFALSGESDSGLSFGAAIDLEDALDRAAGLNDTTDDRGQNPDYTVFVKGTFGTLTLGDTDGALDWAVTDAGNIGNPGSLADDETVHIGFLGDFADGYYNGQVLRYEYAFGALGFAVSTELDETGTYDSGYSIGVKYALDLGATTVNLGAGYQNATAGFGGATLIGVVVPTGLELDLWGVSADATFAGGFSAGVEYSNYDYSDGTTADHWSVGLGYTTGPVSLHANYGMYDTVGGPGTGQSEGFGLAAAYDLGGGLAAKVGYGHSSPLAGTDYSTWSLGLSMAF